MTSIINRIFLSSSKISVVKENNSSPNLPPLQKGSLIQAKVVQLLSSRQAQILLLGKTITAKTHTPLKPGETIFLRVMKTTPTTVFKIEPPNVLPEKQLYDAVKTLGRTGPFKHMEGLLKQAVEWEASPNPSAAMKPLERFVRLVQTAALQSGKPDTGVLGRFIENSGMKWENKLLSFFSGNTDFSPPKVQELVNNDFKALALETSARIPEEQQSILHSIQSFSRSMENLQVLNQQLFDDSGRFFLHLPILFDGTLTFGQLFIDLNHALEEHPPEEKTLRVSFLLEMTRLGEFLADFSILNNQIRGSFGVANPDVQQLIRENIPDLQTKLISHGFIVYPITCRILSPETLAGTSLIETFLSGPEDGMLNIVI